MDIIKQIDEYQETNITYHLFHLMTTNNIYNFRYQ